VNGGTPRGKKVVKVNAAYETGEVKQPKDGEGYIRRGPSAVNSIVIPLAKGFHREEEEVKKNMSAVSQRARKKP